MVRRLNGASKPSVAIETDYFVAGDLDAGGGLGRLGMSSEDGVRGASLCEVIRGRLEPRWGYLRRSWLPAAGNYIFEACSFSQCYRP